MTQTLASRAEYECFQIELSKNYGMSEWREDVKKVLLKAGLQNLPITFLFSDTQVLSHSSGPGSGWAEQRVPKWYPLSGQSYMLNFLYIRTRWDYDWIGKRGTNPAS